MPAVSVNLLYKKHFGIENAFNSTGFRYMNCPRCFLDFFDPLEAGCEDLYEHLQTFPWYYMTEKWEHKYARQFIRQADRVLEVGAGLAAFGKFIGLERYTGLEFNDRAIQRAKDEGISLLKESAVSHAACAPEYDIVVTFQVLEHVPNPDDFISGCLRCLKPGGLLIIGVPAKDGFAGAAVNHALDMPPHHLTHWSKASLEKVATLFSLDLVNLAYEPVASYHRNWANHIAISNRLRRLFGLRHCLLDDTIVAKILSHTASMLARVLPGTFLHGLGHTVVAVYRIPK
ncbi:MAG: class I SAM-dependent methyltransferase [Chloroflexota bacterium]